MNESKKSAKKSEKKKKKEESELSDQSEKEETPQSSKKDSLTKEEEKEVRDRRHKDLKKTLKNSFKSYSLSQSQAEDNDLSPKKQKSESLVASKQSSLKVEVEMMEEES